MRQVRQLVKSNCMHRQAFYQLLRNANLKKCVCIAVLKVTKVFAGQISRGILFHTAVATK
jgi:hypothetical protein